MSTVQPGCVLLSHTGFRLHMRIFRVRFLCGGLVVSQCCVQGACLCRTSWTLVIHVLRSLNGS
jgi:hypothetical protein